jgi:hypothetical protein
MSPFQVFDAMQLLAGADIGGDVLPGRHAVIERRPAG